MADGGGGDATCSWFSRLGSDSLESLHDFLKEQLNCTCKCHSRLFVLAEQSTVISLQMSPHVKTEPRKRLRPRSFTYLVMSTMKDKSQSHWPSLDSTTGFPFISMNFFCPIP